MVEHFRVLEGAGQYCVWEESFRSLNRLVDFYRSHSIAVERAVYLRDLPSNAPQQTAESSRNPYPNPYAHSPRRPPSHPSPPERDASLRALEPPALGVRPHNTEWRDGVELTRGAIGDLVELIERARVVIGTSKHSYWS